MFAEPVSKGKVNEQFQLVCTSNTPEDRILTHKDIGLQNSSYQYILRNTYYKKQTHSFAEKLFESNCKSCISLLLQRSENGIDYITLESFNNEQ